MLGLIDLDINVIFLVFWVEVIWLPLVSKKKACDALDE